mgnify:CR=1 FL=1
MPPSILVMPDTFTSLGGNQFIDSDTLGKWGCWLKADLRSGLDSRYDISGYATVSEGPKCHEAVAFEGTHGKLLF